MPYVRVCVDCPLPGLYDYYTDDPLVGRGHLVAVPLRGRRLWGVVSTVFETSPTYVCKPLLAVSPSLPVPEEVLQAAQFAARYYHYPLGATLGVVLPAALHRLKKPHLSLFFSASVPPARWSITPTQRALLMRGRLNRRDCTPAQRKVAAKLIDQAELTLLTQPPDLDSASVTFDWPLYEEQAKIVDQLSRVEGFHVEVLYGITGSGKTRVYLAMMATHLARGEQVLCLVPEIHLIPQWYEAIVSAFPGHYCVAMHSVLADTARVAAWHESAMGFADIVIGTRLSVFVPLPRLGCIIVDEEHDPSYKQQDSLRYHARDMAIWRAQQAAVPILLGSATPSLETVRRCLTGQYRRHVLSRRAVSQAGEAQIHLIDSRYFLCSPIQEAITRTLAQSEQVLIFLNRRGYVPTVRCSTCSWMAECTQCSARLVAHKKEKLLCCHHCGLKRDYPECCPQCSSKELLMQGYGTERIEEDLEQLYPEARILRIDRDTVSQKARFARMREQIALHEVDLIIGTQMLAKGHNFEKLTCVLVAAIDEVLMGVDFRREERLFALMTQVIGRAGRFDRPGQVYIQTTQSQHRFFKYLLAQDYWAFAVMLLSEREACDLPPYRFHAALIVEAREESEALSFLQRLRDYYLSQHEHASVECYYPMPFYVFKKMNRYRAQLLLESPLRSALHAVVAIISRYVKEIQHRHIRYSVDIDPIQLE